MANVFHNKISTTKFFKGSNIGKREKAVSQNISTVAVTDADYAITTIDGVDCVKNTGANTITLPNSAENTGRCITIIQEDTAALVIAQNADDANINGVDGNLTSLETAEDWVELFSTGTEWIIIKRNFTT